MISLETAASFATIYNNVEKYPTMADVAHALGLSYQTVRNRASEVRRAKQHDEGYPELVSRAGQDAGIYKIENKINGRIYVGQAIHLQKRWIKHLHHLRAGNHHCLPLQKSWDKHGEENFEFSVLERMEANAERLTEREQFYMNELCSHISQGGYNIAPAANSNLGVKYTDEARARMSAAQKCRTFTEETKTKISKSLTGKKQSQETCDKRNEKLKGRKCSEEHVERVRERAKERNDTPMFEAFGRSQTINEWANEFGINKGTLRNRVFRSGMSLEDALLADNHKGKRPSPKIPHYGVIGETPLSETLIPKLQEGTRDECVEDLRSLAIAHPEISISRNYYRVHGKFAESVWSRWAGTFEEFKRQAGLKLSRHQHGLERHIAKHASVDHYRRLNVERQDYADKYERDNSNRFKTILTCSDLHDIEIDPFFLRVLIDTARRVQPDVISLVGDIFDLPEFGKYGVDPREWDVVGRIKFAHDNILRPLREACPNAQIDFIEGNHEARLLRQLADATPALRAVLSDLHGFTVGKLLGLDEFQINYIAKADLAAWTKRDFDRELANNYKVYYDSVICHHFPHARNMGLPGVNGHHHQHQVWGMFSPIYGPYEWHQLGAGHMRSASYCEGEKWHNGFCLINVDTETRATNFDYVAVTDMAISGGKWYLRLEEEREASVAKALLA